MGFFSSILKVASLGLIDLEQPEPPKVPEAPEAPDKDSAEVKKQGLEARRRASNRSSTFLSGGALGDTTKSSTTLKKLLGE